MGCSYLTHAMFRIVIMIFFVFGIITHRTAMGDELDSASTSVFGIVNIIILEINCYNTFKAMAKLFVEGKINEKQQVQLE